MSNSNPTISIQTLCKFRSIAIAMDAGFPDIFMSDDRARYNGKEKPLMRIYLPERKSAETKSRWHSKSTFIEVDEFCRIASFGTIGSSFGRIGKKTKLEGQWKLNEALDYFYSHIKKYEHYEFFKNVKVQKSSTDEFHFYAGCERNLTF